MKILIVNSPLFRYAQKHYDEDTLPPIGLGYIATYFQENNTSVELLDCVVQRISLKKLKAKIVDIKPEFLATNIFSTNYLLVKDLIESLNIKTHIIIGGLSTHSLYKEIVQWKSKNRIDVVIGDGELITLDIVNEIAKKPSFENRHRRVFNIGGESEYFIKDISIASLNRDFFYNEPIKNQMGLAEVNIVSSRGCIYNCSFCAAARSLNHDYPVRERSVNSIIEELSKINRLYPETESIRVLDDLFLKSEESLAKATDIFLRFNFQWRSMAHIGTFSNVSQDSINALKNCGCNELFIGIESGSANILRSINKTHDKSQIIKSLTKIFKAGINVKGYFICGFPDESKDDLERSYMLAKEVKNISIKYNANFRTSVFQFRPYHGTAIYNELKGKYPDLNINNIKHNKRLSRLIGRPQFNFHSNNYSKVSLKTIHDYICKINMI